MVRLTRIYTRSGDDGSTGLSDGRRVDKCALRIECYGTVDELNSILGLAAGSAETGQGAGFAELLRSLQHDLFDLGADLSTPGNGQALRILPEQVKRIEESIDAHNADLSPLESFVLPGGSELSSWLHLARTVCRRAERLAVALARQEEIGASTLAFLNRLSDLLFVLARAANDGGQNDVLWIPGKNR
ncbi:MAG TPA: cob(I)yrinic acid a,c-diamide adenosyltransferase [Candidatus Krumholzibacteria bacterium]|jgi:cob(I)alamin adenosyltransferase